MEYENRTWIIEIEMRLIMDGDNLKKIGDSFSQAISIKNACMDGTNGPLMIILFEV